MVATTNRNRVCLFSLTSRSLSWLYCCLAKPHPPPPGGWGQEKDVCQWSKPGSKMACSTPLVMACSCHGSRDGMPCSPNVKKQEARSNKKLSQKCNKLRQTMTCFSKERAPNQGEQKKSGKATQTERQSKQLLSLVAKQQLLSLAVHELACMKYMTK